MTKYIICCCERPVEHYWALLKHDYGIFTEFSYQIPQNQGFPHHHFELRELQGIMQNFSYKFHSFRFLLNETSNIYHLYQLLISDSPRSRLPGSLLQTQGTSRYCATFLSQISFLPLSIKSDIINIYHSYQVLISDSSRSRLLGSLPQTQGTSKWYATFLLRISFLPFPVTLDIKFILFISNPYIRVFRSELTGSLLQTQGTSRYYATFLLQISFLPLLVTICIECTSLISNPHIRIL